MKLTHIFFLLLIPAHAFAAVNPGEQSGAQSAAKICPQEVSGVHGAKLLGADTVTSDIVINACVAIGGNAQQLIRNRADSACTITSGYRSSTHNESVGGASQSQHIQGRALDVVAKGNALRFEQLLLAGLCCKNRCMGGLGYYNNNKFHVDNRQGIAAWGPNYSQSGIPSIADAGIRNLLQSFLKNGSLVKVADGSAVQTATGEILKGVGSTMRDTPVGGVISSVGELLSPGQSEDGQWATNPKLTQFPAAQSAASSAQQQNSPQAPSASTGAQQQYVSPQSQQYQTQVLNGEAATQIQMPHQELELSSSNSEDPDEMRGEKPFLLCNKNEETQTLQLRWSCGDTRGKRVWVEGRGFNARRAPVGSAQVSLPQKSSPFAIDCYVGKNVYARASCIVKVRPKEVGSFTVTNENSNPKGKWCIFSTCLLQ